MGLIPGLPESDTAIGNTFLMAGYGYILLQVRLCPTCTPLCLAALPSVGRVATRGADGSPTTASPRRNDSRRGTRLVWRGLAPSVTSWRRSAGQAAPPLTKSSQATKSRVLTGQELKCFTETNHAICSSLMPHITLPWQCVFVRAHWLQDSSRRPARTQPLMAPVSERRVLDPPLTRRWAGPPLTRR